MHKCVYGVVNTLHKTISHFTSFLEVRAHQAKSTGICPSVSGGNLALRR